MDFPMNYHLLVVGFLSVSFSVNVSLLIILCNSPNLRTCAYYVWIQLMLLAMFGQTTANVRRMIYEAPKLVLLRFRVRQANLDAEVWNVRRIPALYDCILPCCIVYSHNKKLSTQKWKNGDVSAFLG